MQVIVEGAQPATLGARQMLQKRGLADILEQRRLFIERVYMIKDAALLGYEIDFQLDGIGALWSPSRGL